TLTMGYVADQALFTVHVGDSRCYLLRQGELSQLTTDHTLTQQLVQNGLLSPNDVEHNPFRNVVTNAIGGREPGVRPQVNKVHLHTGDLILLCTDGLTKMIPDDDIAHILRDTNTPSLACARLVLEANARGGLDNITAVVAVYDGPAPMIDW